MALPRALARLGASPPPAQAGGLSIFTALCRGLDNAEMTIGWQLQRVAGQRRLSLSSRQHLRHLIPVFPLKGTSSLLWRSSPPLLKEEGDAILHAFVSDI